VLIDWNKCIGCKYCMIACPYGVRFYTDEKPLIEPNVKTAFPGDSARQWNPPWKMPNASEDPSKGVGVQPHGVVSKCTFCHHRVSKAPKGTVDLDPANPATREFTPACVVTCAPGARVFGDLSDPRSEINKLISNKGGVRLLDHTGNKPQVYYVSGATGAAVPATRHTHKA
jgi:molybdopterin-containing oxidoreductase family iron-sulfur binding subunit